MTTLKAAAAVTALVYANGCDVEPVFRALVDHLVDGGCTVAGFVERKVAVPGHHRCDMVLEEVASGARISISQKRGLHARGCMLDTAELTRAEGLARTALEDAPALLVINKFGKSEAEGGGFRALIAEALSREVPILIAVPSRNLDAWRAFVGTLAAEIDIAALSRDPSIACAQLGVTIESRDAGRASGVAATQREPLP